MSRGRRPDRMSQDNVAAPPLTALRDKHLLGMEELRADEILLVLDTADALKEVGAGDHQEADVAARPDGD